MHFFKEEHADNLCPWCRREHSKNWISEWYNYIHYKVIFCDNCGYKTSKRSDFISSGHF
ncbi:MAG: hypothetical protein QXG00_01055 [Candidatus Woesearchaeota archaeon]